MDMIQVFFSFFLNRDTDQICNIFMYIYSDYF